MINGQKTAVELLIRYLSNKPLEKLPKMFSLVERLDRGNLHTTQIQAAKKALLDEESNWRRLVENLFREVDTRVLRKAMECFIVNANLLGGARAQEAAEKNDCNIPWAILMDPTSACNISCEGCWAAEYGAKNNLSYDVLDFICRQGK